MESDTWIYWIEVMLEVIRFIPYDVSNILISFYIPQVSISSFSIRVQGLKNLIINTAQDDH